MRAATLREARKRARSPTRAHLSANAPASPRDSEPKLNRDVGGKEPVTLALTEADLCCTDEIFVEGMSVAIPSQEASHRLAKKPRVESRSPTEGVTQSAAQVPAPDSPPRRKRGRPPKNAPRDPKASKAKTKVVRQLNFDGVASPRTECGEDDEHGTPPPADAASSIGLDRDYMKCMNKCIGISRTMAVAPDPPASCETDHGFDAEELSVLDSLFDGHRHIRPHRRPRCTVVHLTRRVRQVYACGGTHEGVAWTEACALDGDVRHRTRACLSVCVCFGAVVLSARSELTARRLPIYFDP